MPSVSPQPQNHRHRQESSYVNSLRIATGYLPPAAKIGVPGLGVQPQAVESPPRSTGVVPFDLCPGPSQAAPARWQVARDLVCRARPRGAGSSHGLLENRMRATALASGTGSQWPRVSACPSPPRPNQNRLTSGSHLDVACIALMAIHDPCAVPIGTCATCPRHKPERSHTDGLKQGTRGFSVRVAAPARDLLAAVTRIRAGTP